MEELQGWTFLVVGINLLVLAVAPLVPEEPPQTRVEPAASAPATYRDSETGQFAAYRTPGAKRRLYVHYAAVVLAVVVIVLAIIKLAD